MYLNMVHVHIIILAYEGVEIIRRLNRRPNLVRKQRNYSGTLLLWKIAQQCAVGTLPPFCGVSQQEVDPLPFSVFVCTVLGAVQFPGTYV